jgi:hypothetical protein
VASLSVGVWALTTIDEFNVQGNMSYEGLGEGYNNPVLMSDLPLTFADGDEAGTKIIASCTDKTITSIKFTFDNKQWYLGSDSGELSAEGDVRTWTGSANAVKFTCTGTDKDHRAYIKEIEVTYN